MSAWKIAKLILDNCNSPQDVDEMLLTLDSFAEMQELRGMIASFSTTARNEPPVATNGGPSSRKYEPQTSSPEQKPTILTGVSSGTTVKQMEILFRECGMTNKQVEQWFSAKFKIAKPIGKGSLRNYLAMILSEIDLGLTNRILSTIQRESLPGSSIKSDIEDYWDKLDAHFESPNDG